MSGPASRLLSGSPRLHYLEWNPTAARALILLHGNCANAWWWKPTVQALTGHEIRVLALDLRGHGDSEWLSLHDTHLQIMRMTWLASSPRPVAKAPSWQATVWVELPFWNFCRVMMHWSGRRWLLT